MEGLKNQAYVQEAEAEKYREKIAEATSKINDPKFLKRVYISLREYINKLEPE